MGLISKITDYWNYTQGFFQVKLQVGGALVPWRPNSVQKILLSELLKHRNRAGFYLVLKARRLGVSTLVASLFSHRVFTRPHLRGLVVAHRTQDVETLFHIYERFYDNMPDTYEGFPIRPKRSGGRGKRIYLPGLDSSLEVFSASTPEAGRGGDAQIVHLSEFPFYPEPEQFLGSFLAQFPITGDGILVVEGTANGPSGCFYELWQSAVRGENEYKHMFFPWFMEKTFRLPDAAPRETWDEEEKSLHERFGVDGHQIAWLRFQEDTAYCGNSNIRRREFPATPEEAFTNIGGKVWDTDVIMSIYERREPVLEGVMGVPRPRQSKGGPLLIWEHPQLGAQYVIGADVAGGLGEDADASVASVWRVSRKPGEWPVQVAEYHIKNEDVISYANSLNLLGAYYNTALLAVEVTGLGRGTQNALQRVYPYPRLHRWIPWDRYKSGSDTWGWETSWKSKQVMMGLADWLFRGQKCTIRSPGLVEELLYFQMVAPEVYEGKRGDDRIMAAMIAFCSWFQHSFPGVSLSDLREQLQQIYGASKPRPMTTRSYDEAVGQEGNW